MKTGILFLLGFLWLHVQLSAAVQERHLSDTSAVEVVQEAQTFYVQYVTKNVQERDIVISIFNEQNEVVFSESFRNKGSFKKPYNFGGLADGIYIIKITDEQQVIVRPVLYKDPGLEAAANVVEEIKKNIVLRVNELPEKKGKFRVGIYSNHDYELFLKILNDKQEQVFSGKAASKTVKVFDLSKNYSRKFYFQVFDTKQNLLHEIAL